MGKLYFNECLFYRGCGNDVIGFLESIGYENSHCGCGSENSIATTHWGNYTVISEKLFDNPDPKVSWNANGKRYDCGSNRELFYALAALNRENDKHQWFVLGNGQWYKCLYKKYVGDGRKATRDEIIEHFK